MFHSCEADPEALAKYVMALIKKDKSEDDLKRNCLDQLEVFLQKNTQSFVDMFFASVKSKSYLKPMESSTTRTTTTTSSDPSTNTTQSSSEPHSSSTAPSQTSNSQPTQGSSSSDSRRKQERSSERSSARHPRSRSPPRVPVAKPRRREGWDDRDGESKSVRSQRPRRSRSRSRSRSPPHRSSPHRRAPPRSRTPEKSSDSGKRKRGTPSPSDRKKKERCRDYEEQGFCLKGDLCPFDHGSDPVVLDGIPFPNGANGPIPPPQQAPLQAPLQQTPLLPTPGSWPPEPYNPEAPAINSRAPPQGMLIPPPGVMTPHFNGPWNVPQIPQQRIIHSGPTRVLSTIVPVSDVGSGHNEAPPPPYLGRHQNRGHGRGFHHRHPRGRMQRRMEDPEKRTLEVRKIPPELNSITKLNEYFSKFGEVTQINVSFDGDREAALITFASHVQASTAHRCPDAVLGNRFIKVFWHSKERQEQEPSKSDDVEPGSNESEPSSLGTQRKVETKGRKPNVRDRLGFQIPVEEVQITIPSKPVQDPKLLKKSNVAKKDSVESNPQMPIKLPGEIKKEKYLNKLEMKKKKTDVLNALNEQRTLVKKKYENAKNKTEEVKYLMMFDKLDSKYKKYEEEVRKIEEDLAIESAAFFNRGRGRGSSSSLPPFPRLPRPQQLLESPEEKPPLEDVATGPEEIPPLLQASE